MFKLKNPTDKDLEIVFQGKVLAVEANGSVTLEDEEATHWKQIHEFLEISEIVPSAKITEVEEPKGDVIVKEPVKEPKETKVIKEKETKTK